MKKNKLKSGQTMLLIVLVLGATIVSVTTIAGILMVNQLHQNTDTANSAKAIFGADAGIEWGLYQSSHTFPNHPKPVFSNGAKFSTTCYDKNNTEVDCTSTSTAAIIATSTAGTSQRALELSF